MKKKIIIAICVLVLILAAGGWLVYQYVYPDYQFWKFKQAYDKMMQGYEEMLKNDTYGGKTPQETYDLFIEALKRGDTDSASKYFYWERQVAQKEKLDELKAKGELEKYIADLPKWSQLKEEEYWDKDTKQYSYEYIKEKDEEYFDRLLGKNSIIKAGKYKSFLDFQLNKLANIWKIYSL